MAQPHMGHMEQVLHIFSYLKCHLQSNTVFEPNEINWNEDQFKQYNWKDFYHEAKEVIPPNKPEPRGISVQMNMFCDSDHAGNKLTCPPHTGILIYLNSSPILEGRRGDTAKKTKTNKTMNHYNTDMVIVGDEGIKDDASDIAVDDAEAAALWEALALVYRLSNLLLVLGCLMNFKGTMNSLLLLLIKVMTPMVGTTWAG
jgi:hypothetical protein